MKENPRIASIRNKVKEVFRPRNLLFVLPIALVACSWLGYFGDSNKIADPTPPPAATATATSVLQPYFDVMQEYGETHKGECQVSADCLAGEQVCKVDVTKDDKQRDVFTGSCVAPALLGLTPFAPFDPIDLTGTPPAP
jgi:hypothetical protein